MGDYLEDSKEGKWRLHDDWYLHITLFALPKKKNKFLFKQTSAEDAEKEEEDNIKCLIHIRRWFFLEGHHLPSREGLACTAYTWKYLLQALESYKTKLQSDSDADAEGSVEDDVLPKQKKSSHPKRRSSEILENTSKRKNVIKNSTI